MRTRSARRLAWSLWLVAFTMLVATVVLDVLRAEREDLVFLIIAPAMTMGYATVGALVASRHPGNPIGWLFLVTGIGLVLAGVTDNYAHRALSPNSSLPLGTAAALVNQFSFILAIPPIPLAFLLYPDGHPPSSRWRVVAWVIVVGPLVGSVGIAIQPRTVEFGDVRVANPFGVETLDWLAGTLATAGGVVSVAAGLACIVGLILRFRRAGGEERQQLRWLAYVGATTGLLLIAMFASGFAGEGISDFFFYAFFASFGLGVPVAAGIAILRYRLYELDIVIKKTVVFGLLAAFITLVYVVIVLAIPTAVIGVGTDQAGFGVLPMVAAAVIALMVSPLRARARRLADRLVYGKRATPYEVLSEFSDRLAGTYSTEDVLPRMVQILGEGTGARRAEVWLRVGPTIRREALWPPEDGISAPSLQVSGDELPEIPGTEAAVPVQHHGELLGALAVAMPPSEPLTPSQEKLVRDLAAQAGLVLRNVRLIEELRASRQRLVAAQDEERRRLERNLHDGAQQELVALAVKLRLAEGLVQDPQRELELLASLQADAQAALENLRELARGIYPPLLADKGLAEALQAQGRRAPIAVEVSTDGVGRYPQEAEAALYFCCLEALQNVAKYAQALKATIALVERDGWLTFTVADDGVGFEPERAPTGTGLQGMSDRLEALGGSLEVRSSPNQGTTVTGRIPVHASEGSASLG
ncbi:MAG: ATP-binding protein [Actinomycetota bacterium]